ncbi:MAG TPA: hypothetical protein VK168_03995 [Saprospiraceae bacterium]|nr:hypothetical protein [Saprospiraceae bacterium]
MLKFLKSLLADSVKPFRIFDSLEAPEPNFSIVVRHVRQGKKSRNYLLSDADKFPGIVEKWCFPPGDAVGRCGYDYQLVLTNGEQVITADICFSCKTLVFQHRHVYAISPGEIMRLLEEDFVPL